MKKYFIFNGRDSRDFEIYLEEYPPIVTPKERIKTITVPGRSGTLHMREAEGVYESYTKNFEIIAVNPARIDEIKEWLKGAGELIIGNELDYIYSAFINAEIEFTRFFRGWRKAVIPIEVQPYKASKNKTKVVFTKDLTEFNVESTNAEELTFNVVINKPEANSIRKARFQILINDVEVKWVSMAALEIVATSSDNVPENTYCKYSSVNFDKMEVSEEAVIKGENKAYINNSITFSQKPRLKPRKNTVKFIYDGTFEAAVLEYNEVRL